MEEMRDKKAIGHTENSFNHHNNPKRQALS